jgi:Na+/H+ antiporter NhaD/arsenite permease-like protein
MNIGSFLLLMLPYTLVSFILLAVYCLYLGKKCEKGDASASLQSFRNMTSHTHLQGGTGDIVRYLLLFALSLMTVAGRIPYLVTLGIVLVVLVLFDRKLFAKIDYALLITFVGFFVFIGNMGSIPLIREILGSLIAGNEVLVGIVASQAISNVPAALLLSEFTQNGKDLLIGVNLGGLGTLIASMASLISYKLFAHRYNELKGKYFLWFTVMNLAFLAVLCGLRIIL